MDRLVEGSMRFAQNGIYYALMLVKVARGQNFGGKYTYHDNRFLFTLSPQLHRLRFLVYAILLGQAPLFLLRKLTTS
jgi:hypothetical protein